MRACSAGAPPRHIGSAGAVDGQNGVCGFDQYTEVKTMGYPAG
jgi:hypothetical protein